MGMKSAWNFSWTFNLWPMTGRGKEESLIPCQSAQQVVKNLSPHVIYTFCSMKQLIKGGKFVNTITRLLHEISHGIYVYGLFQGKWPCVFQTTKFTSVMPCLVALSLNSPVPPALDANPSPSLPLYTCASLQDLGHMAQLISVLLDCSSDNCEFSPWLPCSDLRWC